MPLLKNGALVPDPWTVLSDEAPVPGDGPILISWARWQSEAAVLANRNAPIGVRVRNSDAVEALAPFVGRFELIALEFPKFTDGRAYSQARLLRERLGYAGELRATGAVLRDQLPFLLRCGFDSFESDQAGFGEALARARMLFSVVYQPVGDGRVTAGELRLRQLRVALPLAAE